MSHYAEKSGDTRETMESMHAAIAEGGLTAQLTFFADPSRNHGFEVSRDQLAAVLDDIERTFPDVALEVLDLAVDGEVAIGRYAMTGTHLGTQQLPFVHGGVLYGLPPTNRELPHRARTRLPCPGRPDRHPRRRPGQPRTGPPARRPPRRGALLNTDRGLTARAQ